MKGACPLDSLPVEETVEKIYSNLYIRATYIHQLTRFGSMKLEVGSPYRSPLDEGFDNFVTDFF